MNHCQKCGGFVLRIKRGGCGGLGSYHRCTVCGQVYEQRTGGIVSTSGGEAYKLLDETETKFHLPDLPSVEQWRDKLLEDAKR